MSAEIIPIFPIAVYRIKLRPLSGPEVNYINTSASVSQMLGNHTSEKSNLLDNPILANLKGLFMENVRIYAEEIIKTDCEFYITNSWKNENYKGQNHSLHNHANSILSGVYYIDVENSESSISFNRMASPYYMNFKSKEYTGFNSMEWTIPVENNMLILFPSSLYHQVRLNQTEHVRRSIAFNTFAKGGFDTDTLFTGYSDSIVKMG